MPFGGNDWLALTPEPTLEPELPICDPHHHFWDLRTERIPYQRYLLHELAADIHSGHNVRSTVFIEARAMYRADGPEEMRPVGEVEFVQGLAAASASGLYGPGRAAAAIVGHANLNLGERVAPVLEALQAASPNRFRGIRHSVTWDPHPEVENTAAHKSEGQLASDQFRAGARVLARMGLSLEGWLYFPQLPELAAFAKAVPDLTIILNHIGGLLRVGPYANRDDEVLATWRHGHRRRGGVPQRRHQARRHRHAAHAASTGIRASKPIGSEELAAAMAPFMTYCIEQFGPTGACSRATSRWTRCRSPTTCMYNAFKRLSKGYSAAERAAMFHDTAARVYRIDV